LYTDTATVFWLLSSSIPWGWLLNTWRTFLSIYIVISCRIQFNGRIQTNENMSKFRSICINYYACLIFIYINPQIFILKFFHSKVSSNLTISLFNGQDYAPYVANDLIYVL
jgi:hypothetical protein